MASAAAVLQCIIIYLIMAEGGFYSKEDGDIQSEDELRGNIYFIMFSEFLYMFYCNFIYFSWKFNFFLDILLFI